MTSPIIGLEKAVEDPQTGVVVSFHVLRQYQVDVVGKTTMPTLLSYVSRAAYAAGKNHVTAWSVSGLAGEPEGDPVQWCYAQVIAAGGDNVLADAAPVTAAWPRSEMSMAIIPPWIKWAGVAVVAGVSFAAGWHLSGASGRAAVAEIQTEQATVRADRAEAARTDEQQTARKEQEHAGLTLAAVERFTLAAPGRELALRAELADARRVRDGAEARAARYRAQAEGDAASRRDLADRCEALDRSLAEGREVAAHLRGALGRRDAEVILLVDQIRADRLLMEGGRP